MTHTNDLTAWAARHNITPAALAELRAIMTSAAPAPSVAPGTSEAAIQSALRVAASQAGWRLWRNNVGALKDERGGMVRFGLANDSTAVNRQIKSGDLIGIRPVVVTSADIGRTIGQFVSRECKREGWQYRGTDRERAQLRWIELVVALGGDASFTVGGL